MARPPAGGAILTRKWPTLFGVDDLPYGTSDSILGDQIIAMSLTRITSTSDVDQAVLQQELARDDGPIVQGRATRIGRAGIDDAVVIIRVSTPRRRHNGRRRGNGEISPTTNDSRLRLFMVPPTKQSISAGRLLVAGRNRGWPRLPRCASDPWRLLQRASIALAQLFRLFRSSLCEAKGRTRKRGTVQLARTRDTPRGQNNRTLRTSIEHRTEVPNAPNISPPYLA
eukprot:scaffold39457_cov40-Phaeocystis_antarctica.AAC.1